MSELCSVFTCGQHAEVGAMEIETGDVYRFCRDHIQNWLVYLEGVQHPPQETICGDCGEEFVCRCHRDCVNESKEKRGRHERR